MAKLWKWSIVVFLTIGLFAHRQDEMVDAIMETPFQVFDLLLTVILSACLWGGFLNIIEHTGFMNYFSVLFKPVLKLIYGPIILHEQIYASLSSNVIANLLGLGSLATLSGLKAFKQLYEFHNCPTSPTRDMLTLVIINTASLCLFPSSIIMIRKQFASASLYAFYPYMLLISMTIIIVGLILQKVIDHE